MINVFCEWKNEQVSYIGMGHPSLDFISKIVLQTFEQTPHMQLYWVDCNRSRLFENDLKTIRFNERELKMIEVSVCFVSHVRNLIETVSSTILRNFIGSRKFVQIENCIYV